MVYFKHSELAESYHVSLKTVHNWIDAVKHGKVDLRLHQENGKTYIANTPDNSAVLKTLANKGKKYRNTLHHKTITPKPVFYELFSRRQILDIIYNLNIHREIPYQYSYFDGGATYWDNWVQRLADENAPSTYNATVKLLDNNKDRIDFLLQGHAKVNIIDIGAGNAMPVKEFLAHLVERGILHRYIAIDISPEMLHIAESNIKKWFGDKVKFEGHVRDVSYERFDDLLVDDMLSADSEEVVNVVMLLGATPVNLRSPADMLRAIYGSIGQEDILIHTLKPDTDASRSYFDFSVKAGENDLASSHNMVVDLLNIDDSMCDVEMGYNKQKRMRYIRAKLKAAITIDFVFDKGSRSVQLEKGDTILLWRAWHFTPLEIISNFEDIGFTLLHSSLTQDRQYLMTISGVDVRAEN